MEGGARSGIVLAGGRSARMGRSKAALDIGGVPLLTRVVGRLRQTRCEVRGGTVSPICNRSYLACRCFQICTLEEAR